MANTKQRRSLLRSRYSQRTAILSVFFLDGTDYGNHHGALIFSNERAGEESEACILTVGAELVFDRDMINVPSLDARLCWAIVASVFE